MSESTADLQGALHFEQWCAGLREGRIYGQECESCGHRHATPKAACLGCGDTDLSTMELPTEGEVYSLSRVQVAPAGLDAGYSLGIVELDGPGEPRILARLDGEFEIGSRVGLVDTFEEEGDPSPVFG